MLPPMEIDIIQLEPEILFPKFYLEILFPKFLET